jgi:hypothetical protein
MNTRTAARRFLAPLTLAISLSGAAAEETSRPLTFEVRPSAVEPESDEQKLERRLKRAEFLFRSICSHCGPASASPSSAPFRPHEALGRKAPQD